MLFRALHVIKDDGARRLFHEVVRAFVIDGRSETHAAAEVEQTSDHERRQRSKQAFGKRSRRTK
jgi:hypothetical protein